MTTEVIIVCDRCGALGPVAPNEMLAWSRLPVGWRRVFDPTVTVQTDRHIVHLCGECAR